MGCEESTCVVVLSSYIVSRYRMKMVSPIYPANLQRNELACLIVQDRRYVLSYQTYDFLSDRLFTLGQCWHQLLFDKKSFWEVKAEQKSKIRNTISVLVAFNSS
jgi:hypothetical protein